MPVQTVTSRQHRLRHAMFARLARIAALKQYPAWDANLVATNQGKVHINAFAVQQEAFKQTQEARAVRCVWQVGLRAVQELQNARSAIQAVLVWHPRVHVLSVAPGLCALRALRSTSYRKHRKRLRAASSSEELRARTLQWPKKSSLQLYDKASSTSMTSGL